MSHQSLQGLRHPPPTHHPPPNQHFSNQKAKATMDKREALSDTHTKTATGPETHVSLSLPKPKLMTKYRRGCSTKIPRRLQREWLGNSLSFLRYINLCLFFKTILLSLSHSTFLFTLKKRFYPKIDLFIISLCRCDWMDENTHHVQM